MSCGTNQAKSWLACFVQLGDYPQNGALTAKAEKIQTMLPLWKEHKTNPP